MKTSIKDVATGTVRQVDTDRVNDISALTLEAGQRMCKIAEETKIPCFLFIYDESTGEVLTKGQFNEKIAGRFLQTMVSVINQYTKK